MKVWIVTFDEDGEYGDLGVYKGTFSSQENAEEYISNHKSKFGGYNIDYDEIDNPLE